MSNAKYTFLPWFRRGLGNKIIHTDTLDTSNPTTDIGRPGISAEVQLGDGSNNVLHTVIKNDIELFGPGDVVGFNPNLVIKITPQRDTSDFEANYLPCVEFYDEELPWRFSPATPNADKLRPWMFLLTLKEDEFTLNLPAEGTLPFISLLKDIVLPLKQSWAWAHVQVNATLNAPASNTQKISEELDELLKANPDLAFSRIISPRRLEVNTKYFACLIPYYKSGSQAGLGVADPYKDGTNDVKEQEVISLGIGTRHPVYYSWSFTTSDGADFEALARRLQVYNPEDMKLPTLDISDLVKEFDTQSGSLNNASRVLPFSAALMPPGYILPAYPVEQNAHDNIVKTKLRNRINKIAVHTSEPVVNIPPMYGQWHAAINHLQGDTVITNGGSGNGSQSGSTQVNARQSAANLTIKKGVSNWINRPSKPWLYTLNLDPRYRAIAALGTKVIQEHQEKFMDDAWGQVDAIIEANQLLRQTQLAIEANRKILEKHINSRTDAENVAATTLLHKKIKVAGGTLTVAQEAKMAKISPAGLDPAFKKLTRPDGKIAKKMSVQPGAETRNDFRSSLVKDLNTAHLSIAGALTLAKPSAGFQNNASLQSGLTPDEEVLNTKISDYFPVNTTDPWQSGSLDLEHYALKISDAIKPEKALNTRILQRISVPGVNLSTAKPLMAAPDFPYPMHEFLKALSAEFLLPGLSEFPNNAVAMLEPNRPFIEAFMAGLNHEMARELLWREFPTDQRGTYFKQFWNTRDFIQPDPAHPLELADISLMHNWNGQLGNHRPVNSQSPGLVLAFRGDLFRKFPNTILFAQKARKDLDGIRRLDDTAVQYPLHKALIEPDITIASFDLTPDEAAGNDGSEGWFFVFQERIGEARFGLDDNRPSNTTQALADWDGVDWAHLKNNGVDAASIDLTVILPSVTNSNSITWGKDAAHTAYILYQSPVLLGIHASDFMPPKTVDPSNPLSNEYYNPIG